ncbi:acetate/propionate family kinase [Marinobacterium arenosum]|uniref:acetate/propionate family kinase n=1 Tax=Marinobacterium arenosum TaxID=2862496 RepID=UPI001C97F381|nr:acetate kinase [Marinobacterium arenosum]MBY4677140.1 acetate kinase [Marinobacterium arenosum]
MTESLVLVLNCGSSSIKFAIIEPASGGELLQGIAERLFSSEAQLIVKHNGEKQLTAIPDADHKAAMNAIVEQIHQTGDLAGRIGAVGHRVVHGGERFRSSMLIDDEVVNVIASCNHLAPLHNPANISGIEIARAAFPELPHTAVFDTAFHQSMPEKAFVYPLPYELYIHHGVRRYGFHGTSFRYVASQAAAELNRPLDDCALIIAHLGNGASVSAVLNGQSLDTSMGMTPNEGVVHGTRCGSIDPSIHEYLAHRLDISIEQVNDLLWKQSGLLGISGISNDCRTIEDAADKDHKRAQLALEIYAYRLAKEIAALMVPLGRLDALVFTGGIGENSVRIRAEVIRQLGFLGLTLDEQRNAAAIRGVQGPITADGSRACALVIPTNEELMIAQDAAQFIAQ